MWLRNCWCAMVWEHEVPAAGSPGLFTGSGTCGTSCGTTSARSLARVEDQGARTPWFAKRGSTHFAKRGVHPLREAKLRGHQTDQRQPRPWRQCRQLPHELGAGAVGTGPGAGLAAGYIG